MKSHYNTNLLFYTVVKCGFHESTYLNEEMIITNFGVKKDKLREPRKHVRTERM